MSRDALLEPHPEASGPCSAGASIAIDDCYELWESGFISIPYNFQVCRDLIRKQPTSCRLTVATPGPDACNVTRRRRLQQPLL